MRYFDEIEQVEESTEYFEEPIKYYTNNGVWEIFLNDDSIIYVTYNNTSINLTPHRENIIINFLKSINKW